MLIGKWVKNFESTHSVTEDGHIYRYSNDQAIEVAQVKHTQGYLYSTLYRNGVQTNVLVHRVLAEAFIPNPENKKYDYVWSYLNEESRTDESIKPTKV